MVLAFGIDQLHVPCTNIPVNARSFFLWSRSALHWSTNGTSPFFATSAFQRAAGQSRPPSNNNRQGLREIHTPVTQVNCPVALKLFFSPKIQENVSFAPLEPANTLPPLNQWPKQRLLSLRSQKRNARLCPVEFRRQKRWAQILQIFSKRRDAPIDASRRNLKNRRSCQAKDVNNELSSANR